MKNSFFAIVARMKNINRWGLMRNVRPENIQEHSHQTAVLAHALCVIAKEKFGESVSAERACLFAVYHDVSEIYTGDLPTPIKYANGRIRDSYQEIQTEAAQKLLAKLPDYMRPSFSFLSEAETEPEWLYVKAADTLSAYLKCLDEVSLGNGDFSAAKETVREKLDLLAEKLPALRLFLDDFMEPFGAPLDLL